MNDAVGPAPPATQLAEHFEVHLEWLHDHPLIPGRRYLFRLHGQQTTASVTLIKYRDEPQTGAHLAARILSRDQAGVVNLWTSSPVSFEPFALNPDLGRFELADELSREVVGQGTIDFALGRSANIQWQAVEVDRAARSGLKGQQPCCIWLTGLPASGKSTIANALEKRLYADGRHTYLLDGDNIRHGLNRDLGFTEADRVENIRRVAEVARLMVDAGLIVIVSFISPFRAERRAARELFDSGQFLEVFVDTPLGECERRDPKGLYAKARRGELRNFTGLDSGYEPPEAADVRIETLLTTPAEAVETLVARIRASS